MKAVLVGLEGSFEPGRSAAWGAAAFRTRAGVLNAVTGASISRKDFDELPDRSATRLPIRIQVEDVDHWRGAYVYVWRRNDKWARIFEMDAGKKGAVRKKRNAQVAAILFKDFRSLQESLRDVARKALDEVLSNVVPENEQRAFIRSVLAVAQGDGALLGLFAALYGARESDAAVRRLCWDDVDCDEFDEKVQACRRPEQAKSGTDLVEGQYEIALSGGVANESGGLAVKLLRRFVGTIDRVLDRTWEQLSAAGRILKPWGVSKETSPHLGAMARGSARFVFDTIVAQDTPGARLARYRHLRLVQACLSGHVPAGLAQDERFARDLAWLRRPSDGTAVTHGWFGEEPQPLDAAEVAHSEAFVGTFNVFAIVQGTFSELKKIEALIASSGRAVSVAATQLSAGASEKWTRLCKARTVIGIPVVASVAVVEVGRARKLVVDGIEFIEDGEEVSTDAVHSGVLDFALVQIPGTVKVSGTKVTHTVFKDDATNEYQAETDLASASGPGFRSAFEALESLVEKHEFDYLLGSGDDWIGYTGWKNIPVHLLCLDVFDDYGEEVSVRELVVRIQERWQVRVTKAKLTAALSAKPAWFKRSSDKWCATNDGIVVGSLVGRTRAFSRPPRSGRG